MTEKVIAECATQLKAQFNFWVGIYMDKFYDNIEQKKLVGNKCPTCSKVFIPPRKVCNKCKLVIEFDNNWVDLPDTGVLTNFTITPYHVNQEKTTKLTDKVAIGLVKIEGSDTAILSKILNVPQNEIKTGMKLKVKWTDNPKGTPNDILGFESI